MTIGTPHNGAPLINNAPIMLNRVQWDVTLATLGITNVGAKIFFGAASFDEHPQTNFFFDNSQGAVDLAPNSDFLNSINRPDATGPVKMGSKVVCHGPPDNQECETQFFVIGNSTDSTTSHLLPKNMVSGSIVGTNNDIFKAYPKAAELAPVVGGAAATASAGYIALAFITFGVTVPSAIAAGDLAYIAYNAQDIWQREVVGSIEGDTIVPLSSQNIYSANKDLEGQEKLEWRVYATHSSSVNGVGEVKNDDTRRALKEFLSFIK